jgi:16S rRNA processing protein RimM
MNKDEFYYLGKILKTYGTKGHVLAFLDVDDPSEYRDLKSAFIGIDEDRIPLFILSVDLRPGNQAVLLFEDTSTAEDAEIYPGKALYLPVSRLPKLTGNKFYYHEVTGFQVIDAHHGNIGSLKSVMDIPQQSLLQIQHGNKEILVPLNDDTLVKVDRRKKEIHINAPEGLIDIYLE